LFRSEAVDAFKQAVGKQYEARIGYPATFYTATVGDGAREIEREVI
ncbi:MAG TPA: galactokinase, partial [Exiguobacterium sp.]|nr:galactokinase [Exiguobacterium sp.]